jgi:hypothetical protein
LTKTKAAADAAETSRAAEARDATAAGQRLSPAAEVAAAAARRLRRQRRRLPQPVGTVTVTVARSERGDGGVGDELQQVGCHLVWAQLYPPRHLSPRRFEHSGGASRFCLKA